MDHRSLYFVQIFFKLLFNIFIILLIDFLSTEKVLADTLFVIDSDLFIVTKLLFNVVRIRSMFDLLTDVAIDFDDTAAACSSVACSSAACSSVACSSVACSSVACSSADVFIFFLYY